MLHLPFSGHYNIGYQTYWSSWYKCCKYELSFDSNRFTVCSTADKIRIWFVWTIREVLNDFKTESFTGQEPIYLLYRKWIESAKKLWPRVRSGKTGRRNKTVSGCRFVMKISICYFWLQENMRWMMRNIMSRIYLSTEPLCLQMILIFLQGVGLIQEHVIKNVYEVKVIKTGKDWKAT